MCVQRWAQFVREVDPDIITGYNIQNFDLSYLLNRARHLHVDDFCYLGRVKNIQSIVRNQTLQSKQLGKRENKSINIDGRVQFDLLLVSNCRTAIQQLCMVCGVVLSYCFLFLLCVNSCFPGEPGLDGFLSIFFLHLFRPLWARGYPLPLTHSLPHLLLYLLLFTFSLSCSLYLFSYLSIPSLSTMLFVRFQATSCRRRPNLSLVFVLILCYVYVLVKDACLFLLYLV